MNAKKISTDATSATRQTSYLETLKEKNGRRLPVDLDEGRLTKLQALLENSYGNSLADVIRKAIDEVHDRAFPSD